ncbi:Cytoplasmic protein NCK2 [Blattella germanica]|nr:Cytoplasmic protein NCK2 [Blattella germanica]
MGDYSVSLKAPGRNKHFRVHVEGALYCIGQRKFHTLDQLVDHYQRAPIYTNKQGEKLRVLIRIVLQDSHRVPQSSYGDLFNEVIIKIELTTELDKLTGDSSPCSHY